MLIDQRRTGKVKHLQTLWFTVPHPGRHSLISKDQQQLNSHTHTLSGNSLFHSRGSTENGQQRLHTQSHTSSLRTNQHSKYYNNHWRQWWWHHVSDIIMVMCYRWVCLSSAGLSWKLWWINWRQRSKVSCWDPVISDGWSTHNLTRLLQFGWCDTKHHKTDSLFTE